jgi:hypothetical protein
MKKKLSSTFWGLTLFVMTLLVSIVYVSTITPGVVAVDPEAVYQDNSMVLLSDCETDPCAVQDIHHGCTGGQKGMCVNGQYTACPGGQHCEMEDGNPTCKDGEPQQSIQ